MRANRIGHAASPTPVDTLSVALLDSASCSGRNPRTGGSSALLAAISETVAREWEGEAILFHCIVESARPSSRPFFNYRAHTASS